MNIRNIIIEGDNLAVINSLKDLWSTPWEINNIISDAGIDIACFSSSHCDHVFGEANKAADFMARKKVIRVLLSCAPSLLMILIFLLSSERMF